MPLYDKTDQECAAFLSKGLPHYHKVKLDRNITTPGKVDRNHEFEYIGISSEFSGRSVLDVGALDGVISFNSEQEGAARVLAIDVEDPAKQDWGWSGPPEQLRNLGAIKNAVFPHLKKFFQSDVGRKNKTVYDLAESEDGLFDYIFFYGVLYHLRHPLLSLDRLRRVCGGAIFIESHVCNFDPLVPSCLFYADDVLEKAYSNWSGPSESCVVMWLKDSGFNTVCAEIKPRHASRQRFIGFTDRPTFEVNKNNFVYITDDYVREVRRQAAAKIRTGRLWRF